MDIVRADVLSPDPQPEDRPEDHRRRRDPDDQNPPLAEIPDDRRGTDVPTDRQQAVDLAGAGAGVLCQVQQFFDMQQADVFEKAADHSTRPGWQVPGRRTLALMRQLGIACGVQVAVMVEMEPAVAADRIAERPQAEEAGDDVIHQPLAGDLAMRPLMRHEREAMLSDARAQDRQRKGPPLPGIAGDQHRNDDQQPVAERPDAPLEGAGLHQVAEDVLVDVGTVGIEAALLQGSDVENRWHVWHFK